MEALAPGLTVILVFAVAVHPLAPVTITVYPVVEAGLTTMGLELLPVLHEYVPPPVAESVALPPLQMVKGAVMVGDGGGFTVTVMLVESAQLPLETITE